MWGVRSRSPKGQRRGGGTGRSHGPASSEEPLHRSWPLSRIPSPPSWKQQPPLLPPEDVAAPSPCEPAWMGAFHILQSPFLLLDKKALFLPPLSVLTESSGKSHQTWCQPMGIKRGGGQETQRKSDCVYEEGEQEGTERLNWLGWKKTQEWFLKGLVNAGTQNWTYCIIQYMLLL